MVVGEQVAWPAGQFSEVDIFTSKLPLIREKKQRKRRVEMNNFTVGGGEKGEKIRKGCWRRNEGNEWGKEILVDRVFEKERVCKKKEKEQKVRKRKGRERWNAKNNSFIKGKKENNSPQRWKKKDQFLEKRNLNSKSLALNQRAFLKVFRILYIIWFLHKKYFIVSSSKIPPS